MDKALFAQQNTQEPGASAKATVQKNDPDDDRWDVVITKGKVRLGKGNTYAEATLGNIISELRKRYPANVALGPGVDDILITDLKLFTFDWEQALEALKVASGEAFVWNRLSKPQVIDPTTGLPTGHVPIENDLLMLTMNPVRPGKKGHRAVEVVNVSGYLQGKSQDQVEQALRDIGEVILETLHSIDEAETSGERPSWQYHKGAGLFIITGTPDQVEVARKILLALPNVFPAKTTAAGPAKIDEEAQRRFRQRYGLDRSTDPSAQPPPGSAPNPQSMKTY